MGTMTVEEISLMQKAVDYHTKRYNRDLDNCMTRLAKIAAAHAALIENGVKDVPELDIHNLNNGFTVDVTNQEDWGKIHKAVGELQCVDKTPMGKDARNKNIRVTMTPKNELSYHLNFRFVRKLDATDKCEVKTKLTRQTYVDCKV